MAIETNGLNLLVDGLCQTSGLYLTAYDDAGTSFVGSVAVTFASASGGIADISGGNKTITIPSGTTVDRVKLTSTSIGGIPYASYTISAAFPDGGDLIISSYEISVTTA